MTDSQLAVQVFLQVAVILLVFRLVGWLARKAGQPQVVGEMIAGFLMGPSLLGWLAPSLHAQLFRPATLRIRFVASQLGLVLYMFCVGLDFRSDSMRRHVGKAAAVSIGGVAAPFLLGA
jgi:Kef-type K+ transport system membrane component KefB